MTVQSDKVLVYLEKGGACFDIASCKRRCASGSAKAQLCTMAQDEGKNLEGNIWSGDKEENPGLHDSYKVFVPYCTSDVYIGRRDPDNSTAGYSFRGRNVVEAVITDLLSDFSPISITQFVFMGASAGELFCLNTRPGTRLFNNWRLIEYLKEATRSARLGTRSVLGAAGKVEI